MPTDSRTTNRNYPRPHVDNTVSEDLTRLIAALNGIDTDVAAILVSVAGKANASHTHTIANVTGLQAELDAKHPNTWRPALDELTDVNTTGAANGQFLGLVAGQWQAVTVSIGTISGLQAALDAKAGISDVLALSIALG